MTNLISRKTVAAMLGNEVSPDQVRKNETRWGLNEARRDLNARCVRYDAAIVSRKLKRFGK